MTKKDVIRTHARDELGIDLDEMSKPWQAAFSSMICFTIGGLFPLLPPVFIRDQTVRHMSFVHEVRFHVAMAGEWNHFWPGRQAFLHHHLCSPAMKYRISPGWACHSLIAVMSCISLPPYLPSLLSSPCLKLRDRKKEDDNQCGILRVASMHVGLSTRSCMFLLFPVYEHQETCKRWAEDWIDSCIHEVRQAVSTS